MAAFTWNLIKHYQIYSFCGLIPLKRTVNAYITTLANESSINMNVKSALTDKLTDKLNILIKVRK